MSEGLCLRSLQNGVRVSHCREGSALRQQQQRRLRRRRRKSRR